jgi:hypothetical protein
MISTFKLLRPADPIYVQHLQVLAPLKQVIAAQCAFLANAAICLQDAGIARIKERFAYTWQKRLMVYHSVVFEGAVSVSDTPEFRIGLVGAGFMGGHIASRLLDAGFAPAQLVVATRSPPRAKDLAARDVQITSDVESVASAARLLFLCVLPAQLPDIARALRRGLSRPTLVVSIVSGVSRAKLISLLGVESVIVLHTDNALRALQANLPRNDNGRASVSPPRELTPQLLRLSADCFMPSAAAVAELVAALGIVLNGLEFPPAELTTVAMESLLGASPQQV